MRKSFCYSIALTICLGSFLATESRADLQEEFQKLPPELGHVKIYELAIPVTIVQPMYPPAARKQGIETDVWIKALLSKEGKVLEAGVVYCDRKSLGFEYAATAAARQWEFEPKTRNGEPVTCWCYFRVPFRIANIPASAEEQLPGPDEFVAVDVYPELLQQVVPVYPKACQKAGITGSVWIKALVDKNGNVRETMIARPSGTTCGLEEAATEVSRDYKFRPATADGQPVAVWVTFKVDFVTR